MKALFYLMALPTAILALVFLGKTLTGTAKGYSSSSEKIVTTLASLIVMGLLVWAYNLVTKQNSTGYGIGVIVMAWVIFIAMMLINGLANTKSWN